MQTEKESHTDRDQFEERECAMLLKQVTLSVAKS
jgi:hypothetical protein